MNHPTKQSQQIMNSEAFAETKQLKMLNGNRVRFKTHLGPECNFQLFCQNEDNDHVTWNCRSVRYKFVSEADGYIPTANELNDSIIKAIDLMFNWSFQDRYFYLLGEGAAATDATPGLFLFGTASYAVGITVLFHGNKKHLIIAVNKLVENVELFFNSCGFTFAPNRIFRIPFMG